MANSTAQHQRKNPAPKLNGVGTTTRPIVYDLFDATGNIIRKFPHTTGKSALKILRFTAPNAKNPKGTLVVTGHPPVVNPEVLGLLIAERGTNPILDRDIKYYEDILKVIASDDPKRDCYQQKLDAALAQRGV